MNALSYGLLAWMFIAGLVINHNGWRIRKLEKKLDRLDKVLANHLANDPRYTKTPTTASRRGRIYVATKEMKEEDDG